MTTRTTTLMNPLTSDDESDSDDDDSSSSDDDDDSDDESDKEYEDEYDENFFKKDDPEDYKALMAMTEVERELEIENRRAIRTANLQQFNLEQRIRQKKRKRKRLQKQKKLVEDASQHALKVRKLCQEKLLSTTCWQRKSARIDQECRILPRTKWKFRLLQTMMMKIMNMAVL